MSLYSNKKYKRNTATALIVLMLNQLIFPTYSFALTTGPTQPELQSFEPVTATEMVNLFTGDFTYNIPLLEVPGPDGGYPINLFYNSVTDADTEASWVGLGWNINIGSLNREMRGLPDDFKGEEVYRKNDALPIIDCSVGVSASSEIVGFPISLGNLGLSYVYNSYRGAGVSIDGSVGINASVMSNYAPDFNIGLNLNSLEGARFNAKVSVSNFEASIGLTGREGLKSFQLNYGGLGVSSHMFSRADYTPEFDVPWVGNSFSLTATLGLSVAPVVDINVPINASYSQRRTKNAGQDIPYKAYGQNYLQESNDDGIMDFNRENEGMLHKYRRYMSVPIRTNDIYTATGQGIGGVFTLKRGDIGLYQEPKIVSTSGGEDRGIDLGITTNGFTHHLGLNTSGTFTQQSSNDWDLAGRLAANGIIKYNWETANDPSFEATYFRSMGDMTSQPANSYEYLGGTKPMFLEQDGYEYSFTTFKKDSSSGPTTVHGLSNHRKEREKRSVSLQPVTNEELLNGNNVLLNEYQILYYPTNKINDYDEIPEDSYNRVALKPNQYAGFTTLADNGVRYVYGLPVYNKTQQDVVFSVSGLDGNEKNCIRTVDVPESNGEVDYKPEGTTKYIKKNTISAYTHTHLLTSVLGTSYADIDGVPGPSDGDMGYWMKTSYIKLNDYKWRAPFYGANYIDGSLTRIADDMGAFSYGEREMYLPATVETKTHIAVFHIESRKDARGAAEYIQNQGDNSLTARLGAYSYRLTKISLYSKSEYQDNPSTAVPIKEVHFEYSYELCPNVQNNEHYILSPNHLDGGKLTLKSVKFTYGNNTRGTLTPYEFEYNLIDRTDYSYGDNQNDRWGVFRPNTGNCQNVRFPYTKQYDHSNANFKAEMDKAATAWHLTAIKLPSGAKIKLEFERDDYAYVQDAVATQMFPIKAVNKHNDPSGTPDNMLVNTDLSNLSTSENDRRIYFELEKPIAASASNLQSLLNKYIEDLPRVKRGNDMCRQVYVRAHINLRNEDPAFEDVPVFMDLDESGVNDIHVDNACTTTVGPDVFYTKAYIVVQPSRIKVGQNQYHPMLITAWQYLKERLPMLMFEQTLPDIPTDAVFQVAGMTAGIGAIFKKYYNYASDKGFSRELDLSQSFIKLNSPDKIKYGGGIRVKKVTLLDEWDQTQTPTLGMVYDYSTTDSDGQLISSGVLENEPAVGYDECALHYAEIYEEKIVLKVNELHYTEFPLNRSYYPGGGVGYRKVTTRSLATDLSMNNKENPSSFPLPADLPTDFATTGEVVHEYYTAKDFPVIFESTSLFKKETNPVLAAIAQQAIGLLGLPFSSRRDLYASTQGFMIELNNMHGAAKSVVSYGQNQAGLVDYDNPVTRVTYLYHTKKKSITNRGYNKMIDVVDNLVPILKKDSPIASAATIENELLGFDIEFFMEAKQGEAKSSSMDMGLNVDLILPFIVVPSGWPSYHDYLNRARTVTTNKVIRRSGIVKEVQSFDGQATIVAKNLVYDGYTGSPVLTSVTNPMKLDESNGYDNIYNYSIPSYMAYKGMGAAADNWGMSFIATGVPPPCVATIPYTPVSISSPTVVAALVPGDECLVKHINNNNAVQAEFIAIYMGKFSNIDYFDIPAAYNIGTSQTSYCLMKVIRSGKRNLLGGAVVDYAALSNPTISTSREIDKTCILYTYTPCNIEAPVITTNVNTFVGNDIVSNPVTLSFTSTGNTADNTCVSKVPIAVRKLKDVLSTSANTYSDDWDLLSLEDICNNTATQNPYKTGERGIWRSKASYAYVGERKQTIINSGSVQDIDIKNSGMMDNVLLFDWQNPLFLNIDCNGWKKVNEVIKYDNNGSAVEVVDALGIYSSALHGYGGSLSTATAQNAKHFEMAFESFEEPAMSFEQPTPTQNETLVDLAEADYKNTGHIDLIPPKTCLVASIPIYQSVNVPIIQSAIYNTSMSFWTTNPLNVLPTANDKIKLTGRDALGNVYHLTGRNFHQQPLIAIPFLNIYIGNIIQLTINSSCAAPPAGTVLSSLVLTVDYEQGQTTAAGGTITNPATNAYYSKETAHTGKHSLKINQGTATFNQKTLKLENGKKYVMSAWVRVPLATGHTFNNNVLGIQPFGQPTIQPSGKIVEGWQKIEGTFVYSNTASQQNIAFVAGTQTVYFDDLRIYPADAAISTTVYNPSNFRVMASLDANNFATIYVYDAEGKVISIKRETEKGIISVKEARGYMKQQN